MALQETKNPPGRQLYLRGYAVYSKDRDARGGGVMLAVHNNIPSSLIPLNTDLEAVACAVHFRDTVVNLCNIYLPEHTRVTVDCLRELLSHIPEPKFLVGDFNAKHVSWGSTVNCNRGRLVSEFLLDNNMFVLNNGSPTRFDKYRNVYSHIDLSCCSLSISHLFTWNVLGYNYGSDHFVG